MSLVTVLLILSACFNGAVLWACVECVRVTGQVNESFKRLYADCVRIEQFQRLCAATERMATANVNVAKAELKLIESQIASSSVKGLKS